MLLVALFALPVAHASVLAVSNVAAQCSELSAKRDRLHAKIDRSSADAAIVEAELGALCTQWIDVGTPPPLAVPSQATGVTDDKAATQQANGKHAPTTRRSGEDHMTYAVQCWAPGSAFADPSCNCLGEAAHPKLGARPTITIIVGSWYPSLARSEWHSALSPTGLGRLLTAFVC